VISPTPIPWPGWIGVPPLVPLFGHATSMPRSWSGLAVALTFVVIGPQDPTIANVTGAAQVRSDPTNGLVMHGNLTMKLKP
jgi:hypothetical protein